MVIPVLKAHKVYQVYLGPQDLLVHLDLLVHKDCKDLLEVKVVLDPKVKKDLPGYQVHKALVDQPDWVVSKDQ
jgi:hypothetical protein